jgi:kynureninase
MFNVWTSVKVSSETHPRTGQAGTVHAINQTEHPDEAVIRFDLDGTLEAVAISDLVAL